MSAAVNDFLAHVPAMEEPAPERTAKKRIIWKFCDVCFDLMPHEIHDGYIACAVCGHRTYAPNRNFDLDA